jgi:YHS domain-containing protein
MLAHSCHRSALANQRLDSHVSGTERFFGSRNCVLKFRTEPASSVSEKQNKQISESVSRRGSIFLKRFGNLTIFSIYRPTTLLNTHILQELWFSLDRNTSDTISNHSTYIWHNFQSFYIHLTQFPISLNTSDTIYNLSKCIWHNSQSFKCIWHNSQSL